MSGPTPVALRTVDGVRLTGRWRAPTGSARAAVVLVHGFAASGVDPLVLDVVADLYEEGRSGLGVLTYDARGHGESDGLCTLGDLERHDVAAAVAAAREHCPVVVVVGASM